MGDSDELTLGGRMKQARLEASARLRRALSQAAMAELVSKAIGEPLWQAQWSSYELDKAEPSLAVIRAAAALSGRDSAWLAFGGSGAGKPLLDLDPDRDREVTDADFDRAERKVAETAAAKPRVPKKRGKGRT